MNINRQIESGKLVCPKTGQKLIMDVDEQMLISMDKQERYRLMDNKVPILLIDAEWADRYVHDSIQMVKQYAAAAVKHNKQNVLEKLEARFYQNYRSKASGEALKSILDCISDNALCLSIGGGPDRLHPEFINVNIGPFPNVDVVADAHLLPYTNNCVDAIYCEAVLEHLHDPRQAIREMFRVLKPAGRAFICTPFLQAYHGYPHHYQNYTITGHRHIFEAEGLKILDAGTCVGPATTIADLVMMYIGHFTPRLLNKPLRILWSVIGQAIKSLDKVWAENDNAFVLAATTFVLVKK